MRIVDVDDPADPRLDDVRDLNHPTRRPDLPGGRGLVIAEGNYVVGRMLLSRFTPHLLVGTEARRRKLERDAVAEGWDLAAAEKAPEPELGQVLDTARTLVVLEGVNDPENIGAIFRGVAAFGADGVLLGAATGDPLDRRVVRVSMGHVLRVPFRRLEGSPTTWQRGLDELHELGFRTVALTPGTTTTVAEALAGDPGRVALVVGAEGPGLTEHAMRACTTRAAIPMAPGTDSLNVATAATLGLYERFRTPPGC